MSRMVQPTEVQINDVVEFESPCGEWVVIDKHGDTCEVKPLGYRDEESIKPRMITPERPVIVRIRDRAYFGNEDMITARAMAWS